MDINSLPEYPYFSSDEQHACCRFVPSGGNLREHRCARCIGPFHTASEGEAVVVGVPADQRVDRIILEDARLVLGPQVTFTIGPEEEKFSAHVLVDTLSRTSVNPQSLSTAVAVSRLESEKAFETMRTCLGRRPKGRFEKGVNSVAFRTKKEFFMRPVLTRSLSLP
ncbi:hypothetical protein EW145_g1903 [Phellinidium pouzarii]|uniref:Uncharacterized protein n=1 Tax=Phellinidium pouzarii TaxID=167371 RepID=A0A4V3XDF5_9AGAM|nr:hypothetical protein EW145_g1903 [Phellinidium pouzarii]